MCRLAEQDMPASRMSDNPRFWYGDGQENTAEVDGLMQCLGCARSEGPMTLGGIEDKIRTARKLSCIASC